MLSSIFAHNEFCTSVIYVKKAKGASNHKIVIFMHLCDFLCFNLQSI